MTEYRRIKTAGACYFFTVNCLERRGNTLLTDNIQLLRNAFREIKTRHPFTIDAIVILPDHLHCLWTLPEGDADFSTRWSLIKSQFSRTLPKGECCNASRIKRGERGIWQRRFGEHQILNDYDFSQHMNYIHWNPVKHGWAKQVIDWPYSSFHNCVKQGIYPRNWGCEVDPVIALKE